MKHLFNAANKSTIKHLLLLDENFIRKNFLAREKLLFFIKKFFIKQIWTKLVKNKNQKHETLILTKDFIKNTKT